MYNVALCKTETNQIDLMWHRIPSHTYTCVCSSCSQQHVQTWFHYTHTHIRIDIRQKHTRVQMNVDDRVVWGVAAKALMLPCLFCMPHGISNYKDIRKCKWSKQSLFLYTEMEPTHVAMWLIGRQFIQIQLQFISNTEEKFSFQNLIRYVNMLYQLARKNSYC